jgi:hypothetical protein
MTDMHPSLNLEASQKDKQQHLFPPFLSGNCLSDNQPLHSTKWYINIPIFAKAVMAPIDELRIPALPS